MDSIAFATSNPTKVAALVEALQGTGITVVQEPVHMVEPQADTVAEVASAKARQAWVQLRRPVVAEDCAFSIAGLGGFPGPATDYVLRTVGIDGLMRLAKPLTDRTCAFDSALVLIDVRGAATLFTAHDPGTLAVTADDQPTAAVSDSLWRVFVPPGERQPLSRQPAPTRRAARVYDDLCEWITTATVRLAG